MQLIVCCDGTWNDPGDRTHIHRINVAARAVFANRDNVHYDAGVGTSFGEHLSGATLGRGLSQNVREAYQWLVRHYTDTDDQLYLFGFSRGAYTVRSLAGFLNYAGLLQPSDAGEIEEAYAAYRFRQHERVKTRFHDSAARARARQVRVHFLGVFDTVGALGVPVDWVKGIGEDLPHLNVQFHDTRLCGNVDIACQALGIDERRGPYEPTWWDAPEAGAPQPDKVLQVWFPGVHSDVGGGYPDDKSLAEVALGWMIEQAHEAGLDLTPGIPDGPVTGDAGGPLHDSMSLGWRFIHRLPSVDPYRRPIGPGQRAARNLPPVPGEKLHWSVLDRIEGRAAERLGHAYHPAALVRNGALGALDLPIYRDRAERRRREDRPAVIDAGTPVTLLDRSPSGARIRVEGALPLLPQVRLRVDDAERGYDVVWRLGRELGLRAMT